MGALTFNTHSHLGSKQGLPDLKGMVLGFENFLRRGFMDRSKWDAAFLRVTVGSAATRDRAFRTWSAVEKFGASKKWDLSPQSITPKQVRQFLEHRTKAVSARVVQLEASHLRRAIGGCGREIGDLKDRTNGWSSARLSVPEGSRLGLKAAADPSKYAASQEKMPPDVRAGVGLIDAIGLRIKECTMAGPSLKEWARELAKPESAERGVYLHVVDGPKGGRPRWVFIQPARIELVAKAVAAAAESVSKCGYVIKADDLEAALKRFSNCLYRLDLTGDDSVHGVRRAWAQQQFVYYKETGLSEKDALKRLSSDLGHGDGRGRWVFNNYLRGGEGGSNGAD